MDGLEDQEEILLLSSHLVLRSPARLVGLIELMAVKYVCGWLVVPSCMHAHGLHPVDCYDEPFVESPVRSLFN